MDMVLFKGNSAGAVLAVVLTAGETSVLWEAGGATNLIDIFQGRHLNALVSKLCRGKDYRPVTYHMGERAVMLFHCSKKDMDFGGLKRALGHYFGMENFSTEFLLPSHASLLAPFVPRLHNCMVVYSDSDKQRKSDLLLASYRPETNVPIRRVEEIIRSRTGGEFKYRTKNTIIFSVRERSITVFKRALSRLGAECELLQKQLPPFELLLARHAFSICGNKLPKFEYPS